MAIEFLKFLGHVQSANMSHVKTYVCLIKKIPCNLFLSMKILGSCLHDITTELMNLNAQQNKIPKLIRLPIVGPFGGLFSPKPWLQEMLNIVDNKLVLLCMSNSCQIAMKNIIYFHNGKLESVNNTQGLLLLILHLTNMSH